MTARWDNLFGEKPTTVVTPATPSVSAQPTAVETTAYTPWGREHTDVDEGVEVRLKTGEGQFVKHPFIMGFTWLGEGKFTLITSLGAMTFEGHAGATRLPLGMTGGRALAVFALMLAVCMLSGWLALRKVRRLDPAEVFG